MQSKITRSSIIITMTLGMIQTSVETSSNETIEEILKDYTQIKEGQIVFSNYRSVKFLQKNQ